MPKGAVPEVAVEARSELGPRFRSFDAARPRSMRIRTFATENPKSAAAASGGSAAKQSKEQGARDVETSEAQ
jgi:hypothetical protein